MATQEDAQAGQSGQAGPGGREPPAAPRRARGGDRRPHSPRMLAIADDHRRALEMRVQGYSLDQIQRALGYADISGAYDAVRSALRRAPSHAAKEYRTILTERLEEAIWAARRKAFKANGELNDAEAMNLFLALCRELKSLHGLGSTKVKVSGDGDEPPVRVAAEVGVVIDLAGLPLDEARALRDLRNRLAGLPGAGGGPPAAGPVGRDGAGPHPG